VAVVLDAQGLDDDQMQTVARWTNLSETTFVLPPTDPGADYQVRIFTPGEELGFAGHPTLGTCHAWLAAGGEPARADRIVQQGQVGLVRLRRDGAQLAFAAPPSTRSDVDPEILDRTVAALGLASADVQEAQRLDNGTVWLGLLLADAAAVLAVAPDHATLASLPKVGVIGRHPEGADAAIEVRAFAASVGVPEDPVTGSLQASTAQWLIGAGVLPDRYVATQGSCIGRLGRVELERVDDDVWVGGATHTLIEGTIDL
jgi:PhzF family phenazine biosynthesis protein